MNENINLCEILKGLEGIELYSTIFGKVFVVHIWENFLEIKNTHDCYQQYGKNGKWMNIEDAECTIFPSKDQRDWDKFERPIPVDAPMMFSSCATGRWKLGYYATKTSKGFHVCFAEGKTSKDYATYITYNFYPYMIPFDKFNPNNIEESLKYNIQK